MKTEQRTIYKCENCNRTFYTYEEAQQHEKECTKKRVNAKKVSLTFDNMEDEQCFNINVSADTLQKEEDLYKIHTFDSEVDNDYLLYVRRWYMYVPVDERPDKAIRLLFEKAQSDLTNCIEKLRETVNNFIKESRTI